MLKFRSSGQSSDQSGNYPATRIQDMYEKSRVVSLSEGWLALKRALFPTALLSLAFYGASFLLSERMPGQDWKYFTALSTVVRSVILNYHRFPIHNPWICGGLDILSNPQNRLFSPFGLLDLIFNPFQANIFGLIIYSFVGLLGTFLFFHSLGFSETTSKVSSILFIGSGWFGLHFAVGHIPFGSLQLIPGILWLSFRFDERKFFLILALTYAFLLLDGGIYTFVFSIYSTLTAISLELCGLSWKRVRAYLNKDAPYITLVLLTAGLLSSVKIVPVLLGRQTFVQALQAESISPRDLWTMFFNPFQDPSMGLKNTFGEFKFHEYGNYWGLLTFTTSLLGLWTLSPKWRNSLLIAISFWIWTALGWGYPLNPWILHQFTPFADAHVQSRTFVISNIFLLVAFSVGLEKIRNRSKWLYAFFCVFLIFECVWIRNYTMLRFYIEKNSPQYNELINNKTITRTLRSGDIPLHYFKPDAGSRGCYEPSFQRPIVESSLSKEYHGEIYALRNGEFVQGIARIDEFLPGYIRGTLDQAQSGDEIRLNTNNLGGWKTESPNIRMISKSNELLAFKVERPSTQSFVLRYSPQYLKFMYFFSLLGLIILPFTIYSAKPRRKQWLA